jgi:hypothetical protein
MYHCCNACDGVCKSFCKACERCAECVGNLFSRQFSLCTFLTFIIMALPGFGCFYYSSLVVGDCDPDPKMYLMI